MAITNKELKKCEKVLDYLIDWHEQADEPDEAAIKSLQDARLEIPDSVDDLYDDDDEEE